MPCGDSRRVTVANSFRISSCSQRSRGLSVLAIRVPPVFSRWWASCNSSRVSSASPWALSGSAARSTDWGGKSGEQPIVRFGKSLPGTAGLFRRIKIQVVAINGCTRETSAAAAANWATPCDVQSTRPGENASSASMSSCSCGRTSRFAGSHRRLRNACRSLLHCTSHYATHECRCADRAMAVIELCSRCSMHDLPHTAKNRPPR